MVEMRIAAQLYTLREYLNTPEEIYQSLTRVKEAGYKAVQVSGMGAVSPQKLKEITDELQLEICATHVSFDRLENDIEALIAEHKLWNCRYVGLGAMPERYKNSKKGYQEFAKKASRIGRELNKNNLQFIYHNHNFELVRFGDLTGLDILFQESDPEVFDFELDTYWLQAGGSDPVYWIRKMKERMKVVHFKDMVMDPKKGAIMAEVGEGNLNWPEIIKACEDIGVKWCAVEQDICQRSPFKSLKISYDNLQDMGLKA